MAPLYILLFSCLATCFSQLVLATLLRSRLIASCAVGFMFGLVVLGVLHAVQLPSQEWLLLNLSIFVNFGYLYFQFFSIGENSVRVRLLGVIENSKNGVDEREIGSQYNWETILTARLSRLSSSGQLTKQGEKYFLGKKKLIYFAKVFAFLKWIYYGKPTRH